MIYGRGAGSLPTGSANVSDIVYAAGKTEHRRFPEALAGKDAREEDFISDFKSEYYIRLTVIDKPGVLAKLSGVFGANNVSITSVNQRLGQSNSELAQIILITHLTSEKAINKVLEEIAALAEVERVESVIRVEH